MRHIERTQILLHLISAESDDPVQDYKTIYDELRLYNPAMGEKKEYVFLSKSDIVSPEELKTKHAALKKGKINSTTLSIITGDGVETVKKVLNDIADEKKAQ